MKSTIQHRRLAYSRFARIITNGFMALCLVASLLPGNIAHAASLDRLYLSLSSSQMNINTTFCLDVIGYTDVGGDPATATGTLNYTASLLQLVQVKPNGEKCPDAQGNTTPPSYYASSGVSAQSGAITFNESQPQADGGTRYLFSVVFKAQASGTAQVTFAAGSKLNGAQPTLKSGSYVINAPAPTTTPKPATTPPATTIAPQPDAQAKTPSNTTVVPETKTDPTGLIDSVIASPTYTSSTITWKVNASNPTSSFSYGTSSSKLDKTVDVKKTADGGFSATINGLSPGIYYYYSITGSGTGTSPGNYSSSFVTNGYPVSIRVTENNVSIQSARIKIGEQNLTANNGLLTIGLAAGNYTGTITTDTATLTINLTVKDVPIPADGSSPATQQFGPYNLTSAPLSGGPGSNFSLLAFIGILAGGTVIFAFAFLGFIAYRRRKFESNSYSSTPSTTVIIDDGYDWRQKSETPQIEHTPQPSQLDTTPYPPQDGSNEEPKPSDKDEPLDMFEKAGIPAPKSYDTKSRKT